MDLGLFFQVFVNGIAIGGIYAVVAAGFTLVLGTMKILNFAHGEFYMLGAFVAYSVCEVLGLHYVFGLIAAFVSMALLGMFLQRVIVQYTYSGFFHTVLATIAFSAIICQTAVISFGKADRFMDSVVSGRLNIGGVVLGNDKLFLILLAVALLVGLYYFMKLKIGKAMRAVAEDQETAGWQGINTRYIFSVTMAIGCGLAGISGGLIIPVLAAHPHMGLAIFIKVLLVIIIGGMGSMPGALLAAFLVGLIESFGYQFVGAYNELLLMCLVVPLVYFRPGGLLGKPFAIPE